MELCKVSKCNTISKSKGFCDKHYTQLRRYGKILKRTQRTPNKIRISKNICSMELYNKYGRVIEKTIFSKNHLKEITKHKWHFNGRYVITGTGRILKRLKLHNIIIVDSPGFEVDHIDGNKLNNLDDNLRKATRYQNKWNIGITIRNKTGFKGVYKRKDSNKFHAVIREKGNVHYLGAYNNKILAAMAYNKAAKKYHGEFSRLNEL